MELALTYIGGPTALIELAGLRLLTDPTFDPGGSEYRRPASVLHKRQGPALGPAELGPLDLVLLSHDHHADNLDTTGREVLATAALVLTTVAGAERLGGRALGLAPWQSHEVPTHDGRRLRVTATPARHGPAHGDRGPVIGFALAFIEQPERVLYISGDTVWYEGVAEVARRFAPEVAVLFMGAARVPEAGPDHLTFTAQDAVRAAEAFPQAVIVPLHFEGWAHFSESGPEIQAAFDAAGLSDRLRWPQPAKALHLWGG
jgi:L-ascorbate metabolism protein UlaG (beta-lactamase superfamily)